MFVPSVRMWLVLVTVVAAGCVVPVGSGGGNSSPMPADDDADPTCNGGGLPPPVCGSGLCTCCTSCSQREGLCLGVDWHFELGIGDCVAHASPGTLTAMIGAAPFAATEVAAGVGGARFEIVGHSGDDKIAFVAPAAIGEHTCATSSAISFAYFDAAGGEYWNRPAVDARPACTVTVTSIGQVGERIEGTFTATVVDVRMQPAKTLELSVGSFSIERSAYP